MDHTYSFVSGMAVAFAIVSAACGGGGGDAYDAGTGMVEPAYEAIPDQLLPVPDGYVTDAAFFVEIRGNVREAP